MEEEKIRITFNIKEIEEDKDGYRYEYEIRDGCCKTTGFRKTFKEIIEVLTYNNEEIWKLK